MGAENDDRAYLLDRVVAQLQPPPVGRGILTTPDIRRAVANISWQFFLSMSPTCPDCTAYIDTHLALWEADEGTPWPEQDVLRTSLQGVRTKMQRCHHPSCSRGFSGTLENPWQRLWRVARAGKVLDTFVRTPKDEDGCIWLPLAAHGGNPLGHDSW